MLGTPERRNILFALFYVVLKGLDSCRGHGSFEGKGVLRREKPGQRRGRDVVGHSVEVPRMLRDRYGASGPPGDRVACPNGSSDGNAVVLSV